MGKQAINAIYRGQFAITGDLLLIFLALLSFNQLCYSAIEAHGDVDPADPASWNLETNLAVGNTANGMLDITAGDQTKINNCYIGYQAGAEGIINVNGTSSELFIYYNRNNDNNDDGHFYIGHSGNGRLNISNEAYVSDDYRGISLIGHQSGSIGGVNVNGPGSRWTSGVTFIGDSGSGKINITNGAVVSNLYGFIGNNNGSDGTVNVNGTGSTYRVNNDLVIGKGGDGIMNISNGAVAKSNYSTIGENAEANGTVNIDGSDSRWDIYSDPFTMIGRDSHPRLQIGKDGAGTLSISNNASVNVDGETALGVNGSLNFSDGTLNTETFTGSFDNISGNGTINANGIISDVNLVFNSGADLSQSFTSNNFNDQNITVNLDIDSSGALGAGYRATGSINISNGMAIESQWGVIGHQSGSAGDVKVTGPGTSWTNRYGLNIGQSGSGTLHITASAIVNSYSGNIGLNAGASGNVTVNGPGSAWNIQTINPPGPMIAFSSNDFGLSVGKSGTGVLNIINGGSVTVNGLTQIASDSGGAGMINFDNGNLNTTSLLGSFDNLNGNGTINTHGLVTDSNLSFNADNGLNQTFNINQNPTQNITVNLNANDTGIMGAGYSSDATMTISDGIILQSKTGYIGYQPSAAGTVNIDGPGSQWETTGNTYIGYSGKGTLNISNGALMKNTGYMNIFPRGNNFIGYESGSEGLINIDGPGSKLLLGDNIRIGHLGQGTLTVTNGAVIDSTDPSGNYDRYNSPAGYIANEAGSTGAVIIDGPESKWQLNGELNIGNKGQGTLNITNGGSVNMGHSENNPLNNYGGMAYIAREANSTGKVTVDGNNSRWMIKSSLYVGNDGNGTLDITASGYVQSGHSYLGYGESSVSEVTIDGIGSHWDIRGPLNIGSNGQGTLNILNGGMVSATSRLTLSINPQTNEPTLINISPLTINPSDSPNNSIIKMANGSMLTLCNNMHDTIAQPTETLEEFLALIDGTDAIFYFDDSIMAWADITTATYGIDYNLSYIDSGDLAGTNVLTVTAVPEPGTIILLTIGTVSLIRRKRS